jgi:glyoxylase-like metal-dependent hydrolase (beta-lactamase superfamily II)
MHWWWPFVFVGMVSPRAAGTTHPPSRASLTIETYVADSVGWNAASTIIAGSTEAILVDVQGLKSDATRVADRIASRGLKLKAVFITHPHDDHFIGIDEIRKKFPDVPVYMTETGLREFNRVAPRVFRSMRQYNAAQAPDTLETPTVLPSTRLTVDGQDVEVVRDEQGDALIRSNSYVWIPSLRAVVAGDIVFAGVHPWLANSHARSRAAWVASLDKMAALRPQIVVAGHKAGANTPNDPADISATRAYITSFGALIDSCSTSEELASRMRQKFPSYRLPNILVRSAHAAIPD